MKSYIKQYWPVMMLALAVAIGIGVGILPHESAGTLPLLGLIGNISFNTIPSNIRVPLFYAEMDASQAGYFSQAKRTLLIGQKLAAGSANAGTPYLVTSEGNANALFGQGSMLARMVKFSRLCDPLGELWCIPLADDVAAVAGTGTITVAGTASAAGTIPLYIAGQKVNVAVALNDTATVIAASIAAAISAAADLPVTATSAAAVATLTSKWKGATANDIQMMDSYYGQAGGEALPAGITLTYSSSGFLASGATNPSLTAAITAMGDIEYDYVIHPYTDATSLNLLATEMNDSTGRWCYARQIYGHSYSALRGTSGTLVTAGNARNDQHATMAGFESDVQNPAWEYAASYGGRNAVFLNVDPARPTQTGELTGILPARPGKRFLQTERQTLLTNGIATAYVGGGTLRIERAITTYQKNAFNQADPSYLDSEVMHQNATVIRRLRNIITTKYPRHKLAADGTRFGAGQAIVTPSVIRGEIVSEYYNMELDGLVENHDLFEKYLIVEIDATNPNRMNVLLPPDLINQLRIFAVLNQFRLSYPATA